MKIMKIYLFIILINLIICENEIILQNITIEQSIMYVHVNPLIFGYKWVTLENVALFKRLTDGRAVILYISKGKIFNVFNYNKIGMYAAALQQFTTPLSVKAKWRNDEVWYHSSYCQNLYHQLDHFMFFDIADKEEFQPINEVIFDSFTGEADTNEMHSFIQKVISTKLSKTKFYYSKYMDMLFRKHKFIYFRKVHIAIKSGYFDFYFYNPRLSKEFRDLGFKLINYNWYNNNNKESKEINICIIIRKNSKSTRNILNVNEIYEMLNNFKKYRNMKNMNVEMIYFDGYKSSDQLRLIMNRDIIISPHGAGLTNLIWIMKKGVTVIECYSVFRIVAFSKISVSLGFHYISLGSERIYEDMNIYYDFNNENNASFYYNNYPQIHSTVFSFHPLRYAGSSKMSISVKQILSSVYNAIIYHLHINL